MPPFFIIIIIQETGKKGNRWSAITIRLCKSFIPSLNYMHQFHVPMVRVPAYVYQSFLSIALAVYSRSPSAFNALRSLHLLQLPSERTMKMYMNHSKKKVGIVPEDIRMERDRYTEHKAKVIGQGKLPPLSQGVLIWDETKVYSKYMIYEMSY